MSKFLAYLLLAFALACACACERVIEPGWQANWKWNQLPIKVEMQPDVGWDRELRYATKMWNDRSGCTIFVVVPMGGDVVIMLDNLPDNMRGGTWVVLMDGQPSRAEIRMFEVGTTDVAFIVLVHELGLSLGLADGDPQPWSFMNLNAADGDPIYMRISDNDARLVKKRYCDPI